MLSATESLNLTMRMMAGVYMAYVEFRQLMICASVFVEFETLTVTMVVAVLKATEAVYSEP